MPAHKIMLKCIGGPADGMTVEWYSNNNRGEVKVPKELFVTASRWANELPEILDETFTRHEYALRTIEMIGHGKRQWLSPAGWSYGEIYAFIFGAGLWDA